MFKFAVSNYEFNLLFKCDYCDKLLCVSNCSLEKCNCKWRFTIFHAHYSKVLRKYLAGRFKSKRKKRIVFFLFSLSAFFSAIFILVNYFPSLLNPALLRFFSFLDVTPPKIEIISPQEKAYYDNETIPLIFVVNEPLSSIYYALDENEVSVLTGNIEISLPPGRYVLTIFAYDEAGNIGSSKVSFAVTRRFNSLIELINYLKEDDLNKLEWRPNYTCHHFALDFIKRSESRGYYIFTYYVLSNGEYTAFANAVNSINIVKYYPWGVETKRYSYPASTSYGHAVVKASFNGMELIIDPQTDVILKVEMRGKKILFTVLYEGEITED